MAVVGGGDGRERNERVLYNVPCTEPLQAHGAHLCTIATIAAAPARSVRRAARLFEVAARLRLHDTPRHDTISQRDSLHDMFARNQARARAHAAARLLVDFRALLTIALRAVGAAL
jgi:hypothetical protein